MFTYIENTFFSAKWWDSLSETRRPFSRILSLAAGTVQSCTTVRPGISRKCRTLAVTIE